MNRLRIPLLAAVSLMVSAAAVWSAPAPAARSGLEQVPASAPIVLHLRGVQGTRDRFVAMMKNALPEVLAKFQKEMDDFLENGIEGRKIRGLAKDGPIFIALLDLPKPNAGVPEPSLAIIAAVTDYKEFRDNILTKAERDNRKDEGNGIESFTLEHIPKPLFFVDRKGYAVITIDKDVAETFTNTKKITGLHTKISKELAAKFLGGDAGIYVNMSAVFQEYGDKLKEAKDSIVQELLGNLPPGIADSVAKKVIGPIFQAVEDMNAFVATYEFRPGGLGLHLQSEMKDGSTTASLLKDSRPLPFKELESMARDGAFYFGAKGNAALFKNIGELMAGVSSAEIKEVGTLVEELAKAGPNDFVMSGSLPAAGLSVSHFDDPAKAVAAVLKYYRKMDPKNDKLKEKPRIKENAEKHGGFTLHFVEVVPDYDRIVAQSNLPDEEAKKQFIEAMKGINGEKTTAWFGTDGKSVVRIQAPDWAAARKLLDQHIQGKETAGEAKAFREARKEMPAKTSVLGLIDVVSIYSTFFRHELLKAMLPPGASLPPAAPAAAGKSGSAYIGLAVTLQPNRGSFDLFITAAAAQEFYKGVVKPFVEK